MALASGTKLGIYEIIALLGRGGMGEVYRATDTRLHRDVAIKVLPAEVATDAERLARFEREARLLASLNHPNIAHVYGFESAALRWLLRLFPRTGTKRTNLQHATAARQYLEGRAAGAVATERGLSRVNAR